MVNPSRDPEHRAAKKGCCAYVSKASSPSLVMANNTPDEKASTPTSPRSPRPEVSDGAKAAKRLLGQGLISKADCKHMLERDELYQV
jgi:hypothetical protein